MGSPRLNISSVFKAPRAVNRAIALSSRSCNIYFYRGSRREYRIDALFATSRTPRIQIRTIARIAAAIDTWSECAALCSALCVFCFELRNNNSSREYINVAARQTIRGGRYNSGTHVPRRFSLCDLRVTKHANERACVRCNCASPFSTEYRTTAVSVAHKTRRCHVSTTRMPRNFKLLPDECFREGLINSRYRRARDTQKTRYAVSKDESERWWWHI